MLNITGWVNVKFWDLVYRIAFQFVEIPQVLYLF